eukprot:670587-Prorocentrum_minimum.AAC.1
MDFRGKDAPLISAEQSGFGLVSLSPCVPTPRGRIGTHPAELILLTSPVGPTLAASVSSSCRSHNGQLTGAVWGEGAVGARLAVYWVDDKNFYSGRIIAYKSTTGEHKVRSLPRAHGCRLHDLHIADSVHRAGHVSSIRLPHHLGQSVCMSRGSKIVRQYTRNCIPCHVPWTLGDAEIGPLFPSATWVLQYQGRGMEYCQFRVYCRATLKSSGVDMKLVHKLACKQGVSDLISSIVMNHSIPVEGESAVPKGNFIGGSQVVETR